MSTSSRMADAAIAVEVHGWRWDESLKGRPILLPPEGDDRMFWAALYDREGIPHWLPRYSLMEMLRGDTVQPEG